MDKKSFTVEEANQMLPTLRSVVGTIQERMRWLAANKPTMEFLVEEYRIPMESPVPEDYFESLLKVRGALVRLQSMGCQLKDIRKGLVDFPSRLFGKEVLLCWHMGEDSVGYYHEPEAGFAGRRPIPDAKEPGSAGGGSPGNDQ